MNSSAPNVQRFSGFVAPVGEAKSIVPRPVKKRGAKKVSKRLKANTGKAPKAKKITKSANSATAKIKPEKKKVKKPRRIHLPKSQSPRYLLPSWAMIAIVFFAIARLTEF